ncbi:MAG: restriction endonuclease subunit S, partial [Deltaproteobacteria bacterium]|nr:restriction endonuclease subunit S [Deltaproteobacteria bacterium]
MVLNMLFDNYDLLMDSPNSTVKMRKLILQLAVQGKLVEQDPNDEPASELLKRIKAEKKKLITEGKIKKQKHLPPITEEEIPYELPQGWEWVRLDDICSYIQRGRGPKYVDNSEFPVVSQKCIQWHGFQIEKVRFIDPASLNKYAKERFLQTGDLLWNSTGTGTIGRLCVYIHDDNPYDKVMADSHVTIVRPIMITSEYLFSFLASPTIQDGFEDRASGTTNQIELSTSTVKNQVIPLAPLAEQERIVAKVDQLMHLCDQLDACQEKASTKYESLNDAALEKLLSSKTIDEFTNHWQFICNKFDLIYNGPAHVNKLRQAILQLAVHGKLSPQDPNDEPAGELLKRIKAEKEKLIAEGKIKKQKPLPPITEDEILYKLPQGWEWVRLCEIGHICGGGTPSKNKGEYWEGDITWISPKDMRAERITKSELHISQSALDKTSINMIPKGSVLIVARSGILKRMLPVSINDIECTVNQDLKVLIPYQNEINRYLLILLKGHEKLILTKLVKKGMTVQSLEYSKFFQYPFSLPPFAEQKRIVAKVDQLMHLCDELETRL